MIFVQGCITSSDDSGDLDNLELSSESKTIDLYGGDLKLTLNDVYRVTSAPNSRHFDFAIDLRRLSPLSCRLAPNETESPQASSKIEDSFKEIFNRNHRSGYLPSFKFDFKGQYPGALIVNRHGSGAEFAFEKVAFAFLRDFTLRCSHNGSWEPEAFLSYVRAINKSIKLSFKNKTLMSRRIYKLKSGGVVKGFENHYLWKKGDTFYSEKVLSSIDIEKKENLGALDRFERMEWNGTGELVLGRYSSSKNKSSLYNLSLNPLGGGMFIVSGTIQGQNFQRRIDGPRYPVLPFWDVGNVKELDRISIYNPNHKTKGFFNVVLSKHKEKVHKLSSRYFKSFVYYDNDGYPRTIVYRYQGTNYIKSLVSRTQK